MNLYIKIHDREKDLLEHLINLMEKYFSMKETRNMSSSRSYFSQWICEFLT